IVRAALSAPLYWIAANAGANGFLVVDRVTSAKTGHGWNALTDEYGDLLARGVIDPAKVTRSALENAASIAAMLLTTEILVADMPEVEDGAGEDDHGMGGAGY
ncbi:MAG: TCP-1/cpn60 chaperonin family protein, partial [Egibacteraceae bacterium]